MIIFFLFRTMILYMCVDENRQGLPWFASSQVITKIGSNLAIGATITHVFLWYGKDIVDVIRKYRVSFCLCRDRRKRLIDETDFRLMKTTILTWPR